MIALMQSMRRKVLGHKAKDINARSNGTTKRIHLINNMFDRETNYIAQNKVLGVFLIIIIGRLLSFCVPEPAFPSEIPRFFRKIL